MLPVKHVRELIARSATFQSWVGVGTTAAARAFIHYEFVDDPGEVTLPFVIVGLDEDAQDSEMRGLNDHEIRGTVVARFLGDVVTTDDKDKQLFVFGDLISDIKEEMVADSTVYGFRMTDGGKMSRPMLASHEEINSRGEYAFSDVRFGFWD
jgi:hypothetical protein